MSDDQLLDRLKQRKLVQWALAYLAGAWVLLQVLDLLSDTYSWPSVIMRLTPLLLGVGLLAVLVIAWYHGEQGQQRVSGPELLMLSALLAIAGGVIWQVGHGGTDAGRSPRRAGETQAIPSALAPAPSRARSIAVLPFADLSEAKDQEYFTDGITEELLNGLAQVDGLQVAARTSSFAFKNKNLPVGEIARQLGVAHVLEGSIRKSGKQLRITAQLINAETGYHLWSQSYDRELKDVFAVQDEIARAIVGALKLRLGGATAAPLVQASTSDLRAYDLYLRGRYFWNKRNVNGLQRAIRYFEQAVAADPSFALAFAGLADTYVLLPTHGVVSPGVGFPKAKAAARRALEIDSSLVEAHTSLAYVHFWYDWDWQATEREFRTAIELNPNYATAHQWYAEYLGTMRRFPEAFAESRRAQQLDPFSVIIRSDAGALFYMARQYDRAIEQLEEVLAVDPDFYLARLWLGLAYLRKGRFPDAITQFQSIQELTNDSDFGLMYVGIGYAISGKRAEAERIIQELKRRESQGSYVTGHIGFIRLGLGDTAGATDWIRRAVERRTVPPFVLATDPVFDPLRSDPQFIRFLEEVKLD